jgi:hypothetical protein
VIRFVHLKIILLALVPPAVVWLILQPGCFFTRALVLAPTLIWWLIMIMLWDDCMKEVEKKKRKEAR